MLTATQTGTLGKVFASALSPRIGEQEANQTSKYQQDSHHQNGNERIHSDQTPKTEVSQNGTKTTHYRLDSHGS